jgi:hypothetical protein
LILREIIKMVKDVVQRLSTIFKTFLIQLPVYALIVIIHVLGLLIMSETVSSRYITLRLNCLASCKSYFDGYIAMSVINWSVLILPLLVCPTLVCLFNEIWSLYMLIIGITNLVLNLISEVLFFKFASCYHSFPSNAIVVARSSLVILLMILLFCAALFALIHFLLHGKSKREKYAALLAPLLILPSIAMLVLNAILIAQLRPHQLYNHINKTEPKIPSIRMGFFNSLEISQIQNEIYTKTATFDERIIGNLSDVIDSPIYTVTTWEEVCRDPIFEYDGENYNVIGYKYYNCTNSYIEYEYFYQITCSNQSLTFYKDCANASNLTVYVTAIRWYREPESTLYYNCLVNQANKTCASLCTQLLSNYKLILIQEFEPNRVQAAWTGSGSGNVFFPI